MGEITLPHVGAQPRIVISKRTTWERLSEQVSQLDGEPFVVMGTGDRARRLIKRLFHELSDVDIRTDDHQWLAIVNPRGTVSFEIPGAPSVERMRQVASRTPKRTLSLHPRLGIEDSENTPHVRRLADQVRRHTT
jgi:hypothetical protein